MMSSASCFARWLPLLVLAIGCSSAPPAPQVATRPSADPLPGGTVVVPTPRICLDVQVDTSRRRRGQKGLVRTQAIDTELRRSLQVSTAHSREELEGGCAGSIDTSDPRSALDEARAPADVLARMQSAGAKRAIVTAITTRVLCPTSRMPFFDQLGSCYEDDVSVSAIVFDETGRPVHVADIAVGGQADAERRVRSLLASFRYSAPGAPGSPDLTSNCRLVSESLLDCTGRAQ